MALQVGQVFHLWCNACNPPWNKFHVLASVSPGPWFFLINSNPTAFQKARPHLMSSLLELTPADLQFLTHDSWLDCTMLMGGYTAQALETIVQSASKEYLGRLPIGKRRAVRAIVEASRVLSNSDKAHLLAHW